MVGMGFISDVHLQAYALRDDIVIAAMCDTNQAELLRKAKTFGVKKAYPEYKYMLEDPELDVIDIMTPHALHKDQICMALKAGKTVICEKPVTTNVKDLEEIMRTQRRYKKYVYVKQYLQHSETFIKAQRMIEQGDIGQVYLAQCNFTGQTAIFFNNPHTWRGTKKEAGGGVYIDIAVHILDRLQSLFGHSVSAYGQCRKILQKSPKKGEDVVTSIIEYPNNVMASITTTQCDLAYGFRWEITLYGLDGIIRIIDLSKQEKELSVIKKKKLVHSQIEKDWWTQSNIKAIHALLDSIKENRSSPVSLEDAKNVVATIEAVYEANKKSKQISISAS